METLLKVIRSYTFRATPPTNSTKYVDFVYVPIRSFAAVVNFMQGAQREAWLWNPDCEALAGRAGWLAGLAGWLEWPWRSELKNFNTSQLSLAWASWGHCWSTLQLGWFGGGAPESFHLARFSSPRLSITFRHVPAPVPLRSGARTQFWKARQIDPR